MYFRTYLKALISAIHEYFELFGKIQSYIASAIAIVAIFYTANFTAYLEPLKPYYRHLVIIGAIMLLFVSGYKAWLKQYILNTAKNEIQNQISIENISATCRISSYTNNVKISSLDLNLNFIVSNKKAHQIQVKNFEIITFAENLGLELKNRVHSNPDASPVTIEPSSAKEFNFSASCDLTKLNLEQQLTLIKELQSKSEKVVANIYSVDGFESISVPVKIDNSLLINNLKSGSMTFDAMTIKHVLG
ncbi:hypothetical protein WKH49_02295 [Pantoea agglomerans]|uniref:hypothetical protein n=1 Tax=Enterobacter agglomerans TaxID=549 RepID=UPI003C7E137D